MSSKWVKWFTHDTAEQGPDALGAAREWGEMLAAPAFERLLAWLDAEAFKPVPIGNGVDTIVAATRSNTFKEIRMHILSETERNKRIVSNREREAWESRTTAI